MTTIDQNLLDAQAIADERMSRAERRRVRRALAREDEKDQAGGYKPSRASRIILIVGLSLFLFYSIAPVWWLIVSSTKSEADFLQTSGLWFSNFNLFDNLATVFTIQDGIFFRWTLNTIFYSVFGAAVQMVLAMACGYALARYEFRGKGVILGLVIGSFLIPYAMLTLPLFLVFSQVGLVNTIWAVLIPTFISPFSVYLAKVYIEGAVPPELIEAARMDGAGEFRIFWQVVVRMLGTGAATVFLLGFISAWNGFFLPLTMLQGSDKWTLGLGLYNWLRQSQANNAGDVQYGTMVIVGALISVIPLALVMIAMQRFWKSGVTLGAVK